MHHVYNYTGVGHEVTSVHHHNVNNNSLFNLQKQARNYHEASDHEALASLLFLTGACMYSLKIIRMGILCPCLLCSNFLVMAVKRAVKNERGGGADPGKC